MTGREPIVPTRIIPAGAPLPAPAPPPPPRPPDPPDPDWWRGSGPPAPFRPPPPVPVDVHITVTIEQGGPLVPADPDPGPRWWQRIRWGYNLACATAGLALSGPWAWILAAARDEASLAGAWVIALIPLTVLAVLDNARRVEAAAAHPDLWAPKIRAALVRTVLWAAAEATALTLPITTLVYLLTGVQPS
ncbi:hypothetical protein [Streptomyces antibioticus]|uniref:hypothetical protein n=1 Tax=Streptomyces antibioticus TaxID=1890 RepID=UPI0036F5D174